jgi:glutathione synthase/RimK-type ligase-like ATP-grasp enzyme
MQKLKILLRRTKNMSFDRLFLNIDQIYKQSGKAKALIFLDMLWCAARYGIGYLDYNVFGFAFVKGKNRRKTIMTMNHNMRLVSLVNDKNYMNAFLEKTEFNRIFHDFLGREWLDLRKASQKDFAAFIAGKTDFFAKVIDGCGGAGVQQIKLAQNADAAALYESLIEKKMFLVEQTLVQHERMALLNPSSINTLRITSALKNNEVYIMYCLIRVGDGTKEVDNISGGGMYSAVDETGHISAPAFCDKTGASYEKHPKTGQVFEGYAVPFYEQSLTLIQKAARKVPQIRYVGWDVAITPNGPVLIEGNIVPGYDMCQNYRHRGGKGGLLPEFEAVFGKDFSDI